MLICLPGCSVKHFVYWSDVKCPEPNSHIQIIIVHLQNLQNIPHTLICFSITVSGMKNKTIAGKKHLKADSFSHLLQPFAKTPHHRARCNLSSSRCELYRLLVLMLLRCAWRKVLWSGTDLYQSMQMLDVGAGAGRAPLPGTPDCHPGRQGMKWEQQPVLNAPLFIPPFKCKPASRPTHKQYVLLCKAEETASNLYFHYGSFTILILD